MKRHVPCDSFVMRDSVTTMAVYRGRAAPDKESHVRSDAGLHYANGAWARRALGSRQPRSTNRSARTSGGVVERWAEARAPRVRDGTDEGLLLNRAHTKSLSFRPATRNPRDRVRSRIQARWIVETRARDSARWHNGERVGETSTDPDGDWWTGARALGLASMVWRSERGPAHRAPLRIPLHAKARQLAERRRDRSSFHALDPVPRPAHREPPEAALRHLRVAEGPARRQGHMALQHRRRPHQVETALPINSVESSY